MLREAIATGETVEAAFESACSRLGVSPTEARQEILEMPVKKTFGLFGGSPAKVRAYVQDSPAAKAAAYVKDVLYKMGITDLSIEIVEEESDTSLNLSAEDVGAIIGHRGETLDALQYLTSLVANQGEADYHRITLDVGAFRQKRKETLENLGRKMAIRSVKSGRNNVLEPMNPYERRIIHTAVQTVEGAKSWSEGADLGRHVVVGPVDGERPRSRGGRDSRDGRDREFHGRRPDREPQMPKSRISEIAPQPFSPVPLDDPAPERKKMEDAPLYGRIK